VPDEQRSADLPLGQLDLLALAEVCAPYLIGAIPEPMRPEPEYLPDASCAVYAVADVCRRR
jgi:hypothetical protein